MYNMYNMYIYIILYIYYIIYILLLIWESRSWASEAPSFTWIDGPRSLVRTTTEVGGWGIQSQKKGTADRVARQGNRVSPTILKGIFALVAEPTGCRNIQQGCSFRTGSFSFFFLLATLAPVVTPCLAEMLRKQRDPVEDFHHRPFPGIRYQSLSRASPMSAHTLGNLSFWEIYGRPST